MEDEQHFIFDCPAYDHIRVKHVNLLQYCCAVADFSSLCEPDACGGFLRDCFAYTILLGKRFYLYEFTEKDFCLLAPGH